jgi:serine phosphatase RsbU (regulator of sigma subunit)/PAS domain-containing protein/anti-sigma regulatory factor (Ser/Thr protein kinase)
MTRSGDAVLATPPDDHWSAADTATLTVSREGVVTGWSEGARRVLGHSAAQVVGRGVTQLLAVDASDAAWTALTGAKAWSGTVSMRGREGSRIELGMRAYPSLGAAGEASGFVVALTTVAATTGALPTGPALERPEEGTAERSFTQAPVSMATFDTETRFQRVNDFTCGLLGVPEAQLIGRRYKDAVPDEPASRGFLRYLRRVIETGTPTHYDADFGDRAWDVVMWPIRDSAGRTSGVGTAAFDSSEQRWAHERLALLNEAGERIGTTLDVIRTARELAELVVPRFADFVSVDLLDSVLQGEEPTSEIGPAVVLRRVAHLTGWEGPPDPAIGLGDVDTYPDFSPPTRCLAAGRPLLSGVDDPDFVRWMASDPLRSESIREGALSVLTAPLRARGLTLGVAVFWRRRAASFQPDDLVLAEELTRRAAVCVDNARRFTREHTTALTLQRSLLPRGFSSQAAVEAAFRYLPAGSRAGLGGDWFDVVPLSGTRVALVVGDVAGHGVHSSATMGSLRTAVRTLADVDLPPDELLTHLDDLVNHLTTDDGVGAGPTTQGVGEISATCLYAVYDPVSRHFTLASAGHPPPSILYPDGTVETIDLSPGPPLGVGGLPFEATELELPEGSLIALYTDGLIEARDRDIDQGLDQVRAALASPAPSLEVTCDTLIKTLLPERPADDVALLVARTRALHTDQVATWGLPADPETVADARVQATRQLAAWGLEDIAFITELVVSELVTNAIRYGEAPIQLRLIRDRTLICEVSDGSSTAPHLRRARTFDEGGRGLLMVAQLTQGWGTRQTTTGKTIWAEQSLTTDYA